MKNRNNHIYENAAQRIISVYEKNFNKLDDAHRLHWLIRRYRISGDTIHKKDILRDYKIELSRKIPILKKLGSIHEEKKAGLKILASIKFGPRKEKCRRLYLKKPELLTYIDSLQFLFTTKSFRLDKSPTVESFYQNALNFFKTNNVAKYFLAKEFILANPAEAANMIYYLDYLEISDSVEKLLLSFKRHFHNAIANEVNEWLDKIYALTHLAIAASHYYQDFIEEGKFRWLYDYLEEDVKQITENTNPDVVAEVGICFKVGRCFQGEAVDEIRRYLLTKIDSKLGYIPRAKKNTLNKAEHRNILAVMALSDFKRLYRGPNLSSLI